MFFCANVNTANAQFSKAVVMLKGTIRTEQTGKAHSVKVSVREIGDKALEVTASRSNSESGNYLVVLKPGKKYWVHLEGDDIVTKDELVETPAVEKTEYIVRDFNVAELSGVGFGVAENKKVD
ncbi:MAG TPA: hypothetical protein VEW28_03410 [Candidatus Kapabacteria bacterium]|nr:hypothetical protein [Candidatus Kapabacteria bacterium]